MRSRHLTDFSEAHPLISQSSQSTLYSREGFLSPSVKRASIYDTITNIFFLSLQCSNACEPEILQRHLCHTCPFCSENTRSEAWGWGGRSSQWYKTSLLSSAEHLSESLQIPQYANTRKVKAGELKYDLYRQIDSICEYPPRSQSSVDHPQK